MSMEMKELPEEKKDLSFIHEKIVAKKKKRRKKTAVCILCTIGLGILLGLTDRFIFVVSGPAFQKMFGADDKTYTKKTPSPSPTRSREPEKANGKKTEIVVQKSIKLEDYAELYTQIGTLAARINDSIVTVTGSMKKVDGLNNSYENKNITSGTVFKKDSKYIYLFAPYGRLKNAKNIGVTFYGNEKAKATVVGYDKNLDIAVLSVKKDDISEATLMKAKNLETGTSYMLADGEPVMALGSPNGHMYSLDMGIITNKEIPGYITDNRIDLFHTNINYNENSEGIIVNLSGQIVGVITQKFSSGLNTAIYISSIKPVLNRIAAGKGKIYFGIVAEDITIDVMDKAKVDSGIFVNEVEAGSPALSAGLQNGDIITSLNKTPVSSVKGFNAAIAKFSSGDTISIRVIRGAEGQIKKTIEVTLGKK